MTMKKIIGFLLTVTLGILMAFPVLAAEEILTSATEDVISKIQTNITAEDIQSWAENSNAVFDYEYVVPVFSTIGVSENSRTLEDTLKFTNRYNIPVVTTKGKCLGVAQVAYVNNKWEIASYTMGLDFVTAIEQRKTENSYFVEVPQLNGDYGFLTVSDNIESYTSIASESSTMNNNNVEELLSQIKDTLVESKANSEGVGTATSNHSVGYISMSIFILFTAIVSTIFIMKHQKTKGELK